MLWVQSKEFKYSRILYYGLLFLAANTHLLLCIVVMSIHAGYVFGSVPRKLAWSTLLSFLLFLPTLYLIFPPSDSQLGLSFWLNKWQMKQILLFLHIPLKSFFSIPVWWDYHFWDTNIILDFREMPSMLRYGLICFVAIGVLVIIFYLVSGNRKALYLLATTTLTTYLLNILMPMTSMRYAGCLYISFLCAVWVMYSENNLSFSGLKKIIFYAILLLQIPRGAYALYKDYTLPFSLATEVVDMYKKVPAEAHIVTTYWCINNMSAYLDQPFYCLETGKKEKYIKWDGSLKAFLSKKSAHTEGLDLYFRHNKCKEVYLFSIITYENLCTKDSLLKSRYNFKLIDKREGAIEKSSNLYLYIVTSNDFIEHEFLFSSRHKIQPLCFYQTDK